MHRVYLSERQPRPCELWGQCELWGPCELWGRVSCGVREFLRAKGVAGFPKVVMGRCVGAAHVFISGGHWADACK